MDHPPAGLTGSAGVLIMARAPVPGRVKTRLEPLLGPSGCARLQAALVRHTVATAGRVAAGAVVVAADGDPDLLRLLLPAGIQILAQCEGDLGQRMAAACRDARAARPGRPVIVIGTDCPTLRPHHLRAAATCLAGGRDVVFGPAHDGGYYLVAHDLADPARVFDLPAAAWGGPDVLALSLAATAALSTALIDTEHDLDTPADAVRARADPRVPRTLAALLDPARTP